MYSPDQIAELENDLLDWLQRSDKLSDLAVCFPYSNTDARKFATQGLSRRLKYLEHALKRVFEIYPMNASRMDREVVREAELLLQAFCMNVFGAIDNLAWVWVTERAVTKEEGRELSHFEVVFDGKKAKILRASLTAKVLTEVEAAEGWFQVLRSYRDGIAHQIPIYIPRLIDPSMAQQWNEHNRGIEKAILSKAFDQADQLMDELPAIGDYGSLMALCDKHSPLMLHPQMICDLATVVNLGEAIFGDLHS